MTQNLTWESLTLIEPRFEELLKAAKDLKSIRSSRAHFCANSYWLVGINRLSYKQVCEKLTRDIPGAYKIVSEKIYYSLPDCKACFCKTIRILPKNKSLLQIKKLFHKLKQASDWVERNKDNQEACNQLYEDAKPIFDKLETLGVTRTFSEAVFIFGPEITPDLVIQFEEDKNVN